MAIKIKGRDGGDLKGTSKEEKAKRLASFSKKDNATVASRIKQSENGFKGESKNEYGLPDGVQQVQTKVGPSYTGPKDRNDGAKKDLVGADKYSKGSKGIKMKKKEDPSWKKPGDDYRGMKNGKMV